MYDDGKILVGILVFIGILAFPFAWNMGKAAPAPQVEKVTKAKSCVADAAWMRLHHMQTLNEWRDAVVRDKNRLYTAVDGKKYNMSLSSTCMDCHVSKVNFCDRCHNYANVVPYCWQCHVEPKEKG